MLTDHDIRERIAALLARRMSLSAFEHWIGTESWDMFNGNPQVVPLVTAVNLLVTELHSDIIAPDEFRAELTRLLVP